MLGLFVLGLTLTANAQPGNGGNGGGNRPGQNMTPEQRQQWMERMETRRNQQRQDWLRQAMTGSGIADATVQTSVIDYMTAQEKSTTALQEQARALSALLIKPETPDAELKTALTAYREAVAAANAKQVTDLAALDAQVKFSTQPRVETLLTLVGVLGTETTQLGGIGAIFPESPYSNQGGRGGRSGNNGGRGGGNGGGNGGGGPNAAQG